MKRIEISNLTFKFLNEEAILQESPNPISYGDDYFETYQKRSKTEMGRKLLVFRRAYAECFCDPNDKILDYGTGHADLVLSDNNSKWFGYDIMEKSKARLGEKYDDKIEEYEAVCFFDVLEHFQDPSKILDRVKNKLFVTIPLFDNWDDLQSIKHWKHWKPGEHLFYASPEGFKKFVESQGFKTIDQNTVESSLGRDDSFTYFFQKRL